MLLLMEEQVVLLVQQQQQQLKHYPRGSILITMEVNFPHQDMTTGAIIHQTTITTRMATPRMQAIPHLPHRLI